MPSSTRKVPQDHKPARKTAKKTTTRKNTSSEAENGALATPIPTEDPNSKYAPNAWLSGGLGTMEDLTVPSGQLCLVRRPGLEGLMKAGVLHNVDSLSQIVSEKHLKRVGKGKSASSEVNVNSLLQDDQALEEVTHVIDRIVCHVVVKPEIHMTPNDVTRRKPGVVYADMVDLTDKMFIFNYAVGGTRDLERFRGEFAEHVAGVASGEDVQDETE